MRIQQLCIAFVASVPKELAAPSGEDSVGQASDAATRDVVYIRLHQAILRHRKLDERGIGARVREDLQVEPGGK